MKKYVIFFTALLALSVNASESLSGNSLNSALTTSVNFTENKGQVCDQNRRSREDVLFGGTDGALVFHLRKKGISYQLINVKTWKKLVRPVTDAVHNTTREVAYPDECNVARLDLDWINANGNPTYTADGELYGYANYYLEHCPQGVHDVKTFTSVVYSNVYPGIGVKWYQKDGRLKYDYYVSAGADYRKIRVLVKGADNVYVDGSGRLVMQTSFGQITEQPPVVFQSGRLLSASWKLELQREGTIISFDIPQADAARDLVIDPLVRTWGTYYGGSGDDVASGDVHYGSGSTYLTGETTTTSGTNIATSGASQSTFGGGYADAFLAKLNTSGQRQWGTYYGGSGDDYATYVAVDRSGNATIIGSTNSGGGVMSTTGSHQPNYGGNGDLFVAKFNSNGVRVWSSYYGGVGTDSPNSCTTDKSGNIIFCGRAGSTSNIATGGSHQPGKGSTNTPPFLVKFNAAGVRQWGTYYAGNDGGSPSNCSTDDQENIYFMGTAYVSTGTTIATPGAYQTAYAGGTGADCFLAKFNPAGVRQWGTYYGGNNEDRPSRCTVDTAGNLYLAGNTLSTNSISTLGAHQPTLGGNYDGFLVKFNSSMVRQWATYYGGSGADFAGARLDPYGNILLFGSTGSSSGTKIATPGSYKPTYGGGATDFAIVKFTPNGTRVWGTYYGGNGDDAGSIALDSLGKLYIFGYTSSGSNISTPGSHQASRAGGTYDGFVVKFDYCSPPIPTDVTPGPNRAICAGEPAILQASSSGTISWFDAGSGGTALSSGSSFTTSILSAGTYSFFAEAETCAPGELRTMITVTVAECTNLENYPSDEYLIRVFPNPFSSKLKLISSTKENLQVQIFSVTGVKVYESTLQPVSEIELSHLPPGIYFLQAGTRVFRLIRD